MSDNALKTITETTRFIRHGHACMGVTAPAGLTLTVGDPNHSLLWSRQGDNSEKTHAWSPWGNGTPANGLPGFNGERPDPVSGSYHLGNGYRAYNPLLRRFNCPDSLSPFGAGGINPYAYCLGDPLNRTDPTGHVSLLSFGGIIAGFIGVGLSLMTAGFAIAAASGIAAAVASTSKIALTIGVLGFLSDVTGIASGIIEMSNPEAASSLGWISLVTGTVGLTGYVASKMVGKTLRMAAFSRHEENIFAGLNARERRYYNEYRGMNLGPDISADAARSRYASFQRRQRASGSRSERFTASPESSRPRPQRFTTRPERPRARPEASVHYRAVQENVIVTPQALEHYPLIRDIINNPNNPTLVFPGGINNKHYLQIHPDKVPQDIRSYAEEAFKIARAWQANETFV